MTKINIKCIGVMSGSSMDALDLAFCKFNTLEGGDIFDFELLDFAEVKIDEFWREQISKSSELSALELLQLNAGYGKFIGNSIKRIVGKNHWSADLIGVHGHTVYHYPEKGITLQLGHGAFIAAESRMRTVTDFRSSDLAFGGVGAPMAPLIEKLLFPNDDAFLNLGGIANISFHNKNDIIAFDICGCNQLLNFLAQKVGQKYDEDGKLASKGKVNISLLEQLAQSDYFEHKPPKAIDNKWLQTTFFPILDKFDILPTEDLLATTVEHMADKIYESLKYGESTKSKNIISTGGGAHNSFLMKKIMEKCEPIWKVTTPTAQIINAKEAILIAFAAVLRLLNKVNFINSVTGAAKQTTGGCIYHP